MRKAIMCVLLVSIMLGTFVMPAFAGSKTVVYGDYTIGVTCSSTQSTHTISGPYNS